MKFKTRKELEEFAREHDLAIHTDNEGQLILYTGLLELPSGNLETFDDVEWWGDDDWDDYDPVTDT